MIIVLNALKDEFIGRDMVIIDSSNKSYVGIKGRVMDETHHSFVVMAGNSLKRIMKSNLTFTIKRDDKTFTIQGKNIELRPEDRIKKIKT